MTASVAEVVKHGLVILRLWVQIHFTPWRYRDFPVLGFNSQILQVQHMKLKAKGRMKSSFPGGEWPRGTGCGFESVVLEMVVQILPRSEVGREGAVSPLHVSQ